MTGSQNAQGNLKEQHQSRLEKSPNSGDGFRLTHFSRSQQRGSSCGITTINRCCSHLGTESLSQQKLIR